MKQNDSPAGIGIITIFMVLVVLCLAVLSTLTLTSARADQRLSQMNADAVAAYYQADGQAQALYRAFVAGTEEELVQQIPMTDTQALFLHLRRETDNLGRVLAWQTVPLGEEPAPENPAVWSGD